MSLALALQSTLIRDLRIAVARPQQLLNALVFFVMVVTIFPIATTTDPKILPELAPGVIWVALLFAILLSLDQLFRVDLEDGSLEQMLLSPYPLSQLLLVKILAHWLLTGLPLLILAPILSSLFALPLQAIIVLELSLLLGTPILSLIGALGAALTVNIKNSSILLILIVLPLYIPVLIFGTTAVVGCLHGLPMLGELIFLAALLVLAITFVPIVCSAALRMTLY